MTSLRELIPVFGLILAAGGMTGCSSYPFDMSKTDWDSLSPAQQAKFRTTEMKQLAKRDTESAQSRTVLSQVLRDDESFRNSRK